MSDMKERILGAAHEILAREGPAALTTRRVCDAVGVTMPTLYHHFKNRDALVGAVYEQAFAEFMAKKRSQKPSDDALLDLRRGAELVLDFAAKNIHVTLALLARGLEDAAILAPSYVHLSERVRRAKEAGCLRVSERDACAMSWAVVQGLIVLAVASPDPSLELASARNRLLDAWIDAL